MSLEELVINNARVLITVKAYPKPSGKYEELVCTAGLLNGEKWIRIYPVPFRLLSDSNKYPKYSWIKLNLERRIERDFRPESYKPQKGIQEEIEVLEKISTENKWKDRKSIILNEVYKSMDQLIEDSKSPNNKSLATLKPNKICNVKIEESDRDWPDSWKRYLIENDLFEESNSGIKKPIKKVPYDFSYVFTTDDEKIRTLKIEDWEIGALYWNCLKQARNNEDKAISLVKQKLISLTETDLHFFVGTTLKYHKRNFPNPFIIIGLFYPPIDKQIYLF
jgi:hypothetical protein